MDVYHDAYDGAERSFYASQRSEDEEVQARSYEIAQLDPPPKTAPFQLTYRHAAFLHQISPPQKRLEWCLARLKDTGILTRRLTDFEVDRVRRRLEQGGVWVEKYAPENKVVLLERLPKDVVAHRSGGADAESHGRQRHAGASSCSTSRTVANIDRLSSPASMYSWVDVDLYLVLLGKEKGPRAAPFLAVLDKTFVLQRLREAAA